MANPPNRAPLSETTQWLFQYKLCIKLLNHAGQPRAAKKACRGSCSMDGNAAAKSKKRVYAPLLQQGVFEHGLVNV
eukprot:4527207-Pyramimonas_sp.AAC.1